MKKKGKLYCCCKEAHNNCYMFCPKGKRLDPDHVIVVPTWDKKVNFGGTYK